AAATVARSAQSNRSQTALRLHSQSEVPGSIHDRLCGWSKNLRSGAPAPDGHRLTAHGDPHPARQGPEGSLRDARAHFAQGIETVLATGPTKRLALSGSGQQPTD